ncbi:MAG: sulfite exporter TauE/SafE family protein [Candidatus Ruthia sp.]|nr:sulfite exporter TauE/SafE family protein [Candidatus Ruthturnera sp.]MBT4123775.1 sulfite exporter TauE/SafE family protein [Candidatus Ruthturnera sp.]MBT4668108.1 sulfite exporter TauE/SafE family protein [Candidatus Ruthturnera sp.]MBT6921976.1 sulfite exporter TauE/SafE family protein [Candidatus Ruthturnera sp.]
MAEIAPLLLLGIFSGFIAGLLGVGGGLIMVPALLYLLAGSVDQSALMHTAVGTALAAIVFTSISSVRAHHTHGAIYWQYVRRLTPMILLGAFSGAMLTKAMSFDFMRLFFALFEFGVAIVMYFGISSASHVDHLKKWIWHLTGYIIGFISAIVGIGGGTMTTPFLTYNNVGIKNAIATSAAVGMPIAIAGALGFVVAGWNVESASGGLGFIHTQALMSIVVMSVLFAPIGARVAHNVDGKKLKKFFAIFLAFLGLSVIAF